MNSVSTLGMALRTREMVSAAQSEISKISGEVGSGFKRDVAASIGTRLGEDISMRNLYDQVEEYNNNITLLGMRMDTMSDAYNGVEKVTSEFFGKMATMLGDSQMTEVMQQEAKATLERIVQHLNAMTGDRYLFSGVDVDTPPMQQPDKVNPGTAYSPMEAMQEMLGMNPPADAASAQDFVNFIGLAFSSDPSVPAHLRFEGTFYNGTPALDASGQPNPRVTGRVDQTRVLEYGAQGNDRAFRDILMGVYMIASVDVTDMPKEAYDVYVGAAYDAIGRGLTASRRDLAVLAGYQNDLEAQVKINENSLKIMNERIVGLETVNLVEANARMTVLETQLQASIVLTNKMAGLSIASIMVGR